MNIGITFQVSHIDGIHSVRFDDDGRVAYAYLLEGNRIVADVWLYNRCVAPEKPEWNNRNAAPYANPQDFVLNSIFIPPLAHNDIVIDWDNQGLNGVLRALISIRGTLHATLAIDEKPGYCSLASKSGPLAKPLV